MPPCRYSGGPGEHVEIPSRLETFAAVASRPPAEPPQGAQSAQAQVAAVRPQTAVVVEPIVGRSYPLRGRFEGELVGAQDGGHVHGARLPCQVRLGGRRRAIS